MKKRIALIGSDTIIGKNLVFDSLYPICYLQKELDWDRPGKVIQTIRKGYPDAYVIGYSRLDNCTSLLRTIIKTVLKACDKKAKVIGFFSSEMYGLQSSELLDEKLEPHPVSNEGEYELLAEQALLKYPNSASLRFGDFWSKTEGYFIQFLRTAKYNTLKVSSDKRVSLTSNTLLSKVLSIILERDIGHIYNVVDGGYPSTKQLWEYFSKLVEGRVVEISEDANSVLDGRLWEAVSMSANDSWQSLLNTNIREIIDAVK